MAIGSISSSTVTPQAPKAMGVEAGEATSGGKDVRNDGDADDGAAAAAKTSTPQATTNSLGQTIGANLNVTA